MRGIRGKEVGFTLVEMLMATSIAMLLLGSMYSVYTSNYKTTRVQEQIAEAQQNARAALQLMSRDIMMAGYDTLPIKNKGIIVANKTSLTIHIDDINPTNPYISYSLDSGATIVRTQDGTVQAVAEGINRLNFYYYDGDDLLTPDASGTLDAIQTGNIDKIVISVTASTPALGSSSGSCTLETTLRPRNL